MNILQQVEQEQIKIENKTIPQFGALRVSVKVVEGDRERIQAYEGVCIASFTVGKISYGEAVKRVFPLYSPRFPLK